MEAALLHALLAKKWIGHIKSYMSKSLNTSKELKEEKWVQVKTIN
jgi:hypothetical protein